MAFEIQMHPSGFLLKKARAILVKATEAGRFNALTCACGLKFLLARAWTAVRCPKCQRVARW